ncbi:hypothetical protein OG21DRAFT_353811 [Imleria badia]|nr:hypothetical protein OG21DRAFT_353811 [Imleria badia]
MSVKVRWVKPVHPPLWQNLGIPLQNTDLIPDWMDFVWVLPGMLDEEKLCNALAQNLQDYHYAVRRLSFDEVSGRWKLAFNENAGIPITFGVTTRPSIMSDDFDHEKHPDYVDGHPLVLDRDLNASGEHPLLTLKVVEGNGETTLTLGWCHILGDCTSMTHWANSLSLYYQGIQPSFMPSFEKYSEPDPTVEEDIVPEVLPLLYHQEHAIQNSALPVLFSNMFSATSRVVVRISATEVRAIHAWVSSGAKVSRISEADAVVGLLSACLASVSLASVERVAYILGTRGIHPALSLTTMGNCMQTIATEKLEGNVGPWDFADALRKSVNFARNPENLRRILGLHSQMLRRPGLTPDYLNIHSPDTMVYVNALHKIPLLNVDFGFTDRVRFYVYGSGEHFLSMLPANPTLGADGTWTTNNGGIDIVFRLKHDRVDVFWKKFHESMKAALITSTKNESGAFSIFSISRRRLASVSRSKLQVVRPKRA